jgi:tetratricopeptide (TPR) repeat protein
VTNDADIHFNRGNVLRELRQPEQALESYDKTIELKPNLAAGHLARANVLMELNRPNDALASYDRALIHQPNYAQAYLGRSCALKLLGCTQDALVSVDFALRIRPDYSAAYLHRGNVLLKLKRLHEALSSYNRALEIKPDYAEAFSNRAIVFLGLKCALDALASCDRALEIRPKYAEAYCNRGDALCELGHFEAALTNYGQAIALRPDYAEAYSKRGVVLNELDQLDASLTDFDRAISLKPDYAEAHSNRGYLLTQRLQLDAAFASYDRALKIDDMFSAARYNRAISLLLAGEFAKGWLEYEWRGKNDRESLADGKRIFSQPIWLGDSSIAGKTVLLHAEQGFGDTIQFCRYVPMIASLGARVLLEVQRPLLKLMASLDGVAQLMASGHALPDFDCHCPLMSLPLSFNTTLSSIPAEIPYLRSDAQKAALWEQKLGKKKNLRVGLVWRSGWHTNDRNVIRIQRNKSLPFELFEGLLTLPGFTFFSLQKDAAGGQARGAVEAGSLIDWTRELADFADNAAFIANLDLLISVDTSMAHLAAAMGKPTWILLPYSADWRWLLNRSDSPWYPTVRLYRQEILGDWDIPVQKIVSDLVKLPRVI